MRHERIVLAAAVLLGALLRLGGLADPGLGEGEARHAWRAASAAGGSVVAEGVTSAFLASAQAMLFALAGATTFLARLPSALCGIALLLVPRLVRDVIGPVRASALVALLALDPTLVRVSREASGASASLLAAALAAAALVRWAADGRSDAGRGRAASVAASASLGLLLATGPDAWTLLPLAALVSAALQPWRVCAPRPRDCAAAFGATFALASTAGFWAPAWASAASASLTAWLGRWGQAASVHEPLAAAPLTLVLALVAVGDAARLAPRRAALLVAALAWGLLSSRGHAPALALVLVIAASDGVGHFGRLRVAATAAALAAVVQLALAARPLMPDTSIPARPGVETLASDLEHIAVVEGHDATELPVLVLGERDDPSVRWALRKARRVSAAPHRPLAPEGARPVLIAPSGAAREAPAGHVGRSYAAPARTVDLWVPVD